MKKATKALIYAICTGMFGLVFATMPANGEPGIQKDQNKQQKSSMIDPQQELIEIGMESFKYENDRLIPTKGKVYNFKVNSVYAELAETPKVESTEIINAGSTTLTNNTSQAQVQLTPAFSHTREDISETTTTEGLKVGTGYKVSFTTKLPIFSGTVNAEFYGEYNYENTETNRSSVLRSYAIKSQPISIGEGEKYKVTAVLESVKVSGKTYLNADVSGDIQVYFENNLPLLTTAGEALKIKTEHFPQKYAHWQAIKGEDQARVRGMGTFGANYGTRYKLEIRDITNGDTRNSPLIKTIMVDPTIEEVKE